MPTVPVVEQTANGAPQYDAPQVAPMRNFAPGQIEALGQSVEQAGTTAMTIGQRMQDQVDEAAVKNAEYNSLSQAQQINSDPQTGFLNQKGQDAVDQYQTAQQGVVKAFKDQLDGLTGHQQRMFQPLMQAHLLSLGQQMSTHDFQQKSQMAADASSTRANLFANKAGQSASSYLQTDGKGNHTGDFWTSTGTAEQEMLNFMHITRGASPGSDIANQALQGVHTQIGANAIAQMMNAKASHAAVQTMYDDMKSKDWFDAHTQNVLDGMVKTYSEQGTTREAIQQQLSTALRAKEGKPTTATGTADYQVGIQGAMPTTTPYDPKNGSITINVAKGTSVTAPADGKVIQAGDDDNNGNFSVQMQHADGSVTTVAGLTSANVKVGDVVQRGEEVATSGTPAGSSAPSVVWSLKDKDGNAVDPTKAGLPAVDLHTIVDEKVLDTAVDGLRKQITDPQLQEQAVNQMVGMVRGNQQMAAATAAQLYGDADDAFLKGGMHWQQIPTAMFNNLPLEQQLSFKKRDTANTMEILQQRLLLQHTSEANVEYYFQQNPDKFTPAAVDMARSRLSTPTYNTLKAQAQAFQNNPQAVIDAKDLNMHIQYFAGLSGWNVHPQTDADKQALNTLTTRVGQDLARTRMQNNGKVTNDDVGKAINDELIRRPIAVYHSSWNPLAQGGMSLAGTQTVYNFQVPQGATQVVPGKDGQYYFSDGKQNLGKAGGQDLLGVAKALAAKYMSSKGES